MMVYIVQHFLYSTPQILMMIDTMTKITCKNGYIRNMLTVHYLKARPSQVKLL